MAHINRERWLHAQVVELELEMTEAMTDIYEALTELLDSCIQELRRSNKIDSTQLTLENGLFKSFDDIVRRQLDSVWHTVSTKTKQVQFLIPRFSSSCFQS